MAMIKRAIEEVLEITAKGTKQQAIDWMIKKFGIDVKEAGFFVNESIQLNIDAYDEIADFHMDNK